MTKKKIDWFFVIFSTFWMLFDCFMLWFNISEMFDAYKAGNTNIAGIFAVGAVIWSFLLYRDGNSIKKDIEDGKSKIEVKDKDKSV